MGNYGFKVSQQGYDVKTCADKEMFLHSSFKRLKIYMEGSFTGKTAGQTIVTHNLGYAPMFLVLGTSTNSYVMPTPLENFVFYSSTRINTTNLIQGTTPLTAGYYYIFQEQLDQSYTPVNIQTTGTSQGTEIEDYGIKASKSTDVKTAAVKNLIMTSGQKVAGEIAKLHIVHSITTGSLAGSPYTNTITHNLGYIPMVWWFAKITSFGDSRWQFVTNADDSSISITTTTTVMGLPYAGNYACVVFKDPGV